MQITKEFEWDMGHRIPNHNSKCKNLHGHRYKAEVCLEGLLLQEKGKTNEDMVIDFSDIKRVLIEEIDEVCDHGFMISEEDTVLIEFFKKNSNLKHIIVPFIPTAERIAQWLYEKLDKRFKKLYRKDLILSYVRIWETPTSTAIYSKR